MGIFPVTVCIEKNILSLLGNMARGQSSTENDLAVRQLGIRNIAEKVGSSVSELYSTHIYSPRHMNLLKTKHPKKNGKSY